jgi:hypothetical protein
MSAAWETPVLGRVSSPLRVPAWQKGCADDG